MISHAYSYSHKHNYKSQKQVTSSNYAILCFYGSSSSDINLGVILNRKESKYVRNLGMDRKFL